LRDTSASKHRSFEETTETTSVTTGSQRLWRSLKLVVLITTVPALVWLAVTTQFAAYLASIDPERALTFDPDHPVALVELAERELADALSNKSSPNPSAQPKVSPADDSASLTRFSFGRPEAVVIDPSSASKTAPQPIKGPVVSEDVLGRIEDLAKRALRRAPLNARAVILLGQVADLRNDKGKAFELMSHAATLSIRASGAQYWLLDYHLNSRNFEVAARHADILMRTRPTAQKVVVPILARMAEDSTASKFVNDLLIVNPPWRRTFFVSLHEHVKDKRTPLTLFLVVREKGIAVEPYEIQTYIQSLLGSKSFELAYYVWLQFLTPDQLQQVASVYDGEFNVARTSMPFDWTVSNGSGFTADFVQDDENPDNTLLQIDFAGARVEGFQVRQQLMLKPGTYSFRYKFRGELSGRRGTSWRIVCAATGTKIAETPMLIGAERSWREQSVDLSVPEQECESQVLMLLHDARSPSEEIASGTASFDSLSIVPKKDDPMAFPK